MPTGSDFLIMRILFDQNVPDALRRFLSDHSVEVSAELGWGRLKNGLLLAAAEESGFDLVVTADQNIRYQQNLKGRKIALVVLGSNRWPYLQKHVAEIVEAVNAVGVNSYTFIPVPLPSRPKRGQQA